MCLRDDHEEGTYVTFYHAPAQHTGLGPGAARSNRNGGSGDENGEGGGLRTFARKFSNIDFFLKILPLKDDELVMSEM